ncbi:hypothetical protein UlMin_011240 [Ulmus minor]
MAGTFYRCPRPREPPFLAEKYNCNSVNIMNGVSVCFYCDLNASHEIEVTVEFKPIEHPNEPLDNDRPIQCPLPEPSILNVSIFVVNTDMT